MSTTPRRSDYDSELRARALAAYRELRSYRKTGKRLGVSGKRAHVLVREGMRLELEAARKRSDEGEHHDEPHRSRAPDSSG
jgi:hypothetical protein